MWDKSSNIMFYGTKKPTKNRDVDVNNMVTPKLIEKKTNSKNFIGSLGTCIRPLVLILPKISGYVKKFKVKEGDKDKNKKLMPFLKDDDKYYKIIKPLGLRLKT